MFWNKKEGHAGLPDLPPIKMVSSSESSFEDHHEDDHVEKHGLPSFPDSPIQRGFSQSAIKDAITSEAVPDEHYAPVGFKEKSFKTIESGPSPWEPSHGEQQPILSPPPFERSRYQLPPEHDKNKDVFVRIDKFYAARKALELTRDKLDQIDELLRKIRETKLREEQELTAWEKELTEVKSRVQDVVSNIFDKVE